jgi:hypothetical protein
MKTLSRLASAALLLFTGLAFFAPAQAAEFCADAYYVDVTLPNQARWDMCWEHRAREGVVLHHIHYTPRNGTRRMVLFQAAMAQIHVPYDDNGARYHDVSDYGLGGNYMKDLTASECPGGKLLNFSGKNIICQQTTSRDDAFSQGSDRLQGDALNLFSVSAIGAYNYIPAWRFLDDGAIEPGIGATGALQRFGTSSIEQHGWLLDTNKVGIAHLHNFFWKLDFDLGGTGADDAVEEINYTQSAGKTTRNVTRFTTEVARTVDPTQLRSWRVVDTALKNSKGLPLSYEIQLNESNQRDVGPSSEPFTHADFYVTRQKTCELYASHNPTTNGCAADLSAFTDGESIAGQDIVVWPSVTFYHMPRAEDAPQMDAHWSHFRIIPRDWHDKNPLSDSAETTAAITPPQSGTVSNDGSNLVLDGNLGDWAGLTSFGLDPDDVTGTNNKVNWLENGLANDADKVYLAYRTKDAINTDPFWAYQTYLDTDSSTTTGYRTGTLGADYLIEGRNIWRYTGDGTSWAWEYQGLMDMQTNGNTVEFSFLRSWLGSGTEWRLMFWGNNRAYGGDVLDNYPDGAFDSAASTRYFSYKMSTPTSSNTGISNPVTSLTVDGNLNDWNSLTSFGTDPADMTGTSNTLDFLEGWMASSTSDAYIAYRTKNAVDTTAWWGYQAYLDTDDNLATGYRSSDLGDVGAEYLLEGNNLWHYTGDGSSWSWAQVGSGTAATNASSAEIRIPRSWLGNPATLRIMFRGDNHAVGGTAADAYPNATANPRYFRYRF